MFSGNFGVRSIVLCKCSGKCIDIYFRLKITFHNIFMIQDGDCGFSVFLHQTRELEYPLVPYPHTYIALYFSYAKVTCNTHRNKKLFSIPLIVQLAGLFFSYKLIEYG